MSSQDHSGEEKKFVIKSFFVVAEILSDPAVTSRLSDTKVSASACVILILQSNTLERFSDAVYSPARQQARWKRWKTSTRCSSTSRTEPSTGERRRAGPETPPQARASIGRADNRQPLYLHFLRLAHVEKAADALAVDTLLISDKLFRYFVSCDGCQPAYITSARGN